MAGEASINGENNTFNDNDSWYENPVDIYQPDTTLLPANRVRPESPSLNTRLRITTSPTSALGLKILNVVLVVGTVVTNVVANVTLPIFSESIDKYSDQYYILFASALLYPFFFSLLLLISRLFDPTVTFRLKAPVKYVAIAGFLDAINGLMIVYASHPTRTPPGLQAILSTSVIPFTVIARYVIIRQGVGIKRLVCTGVVMIGLFISMEPVIFNIDGESSSSADVHRSIASRILWPATFLLGFLPIGVMNVFLEKVMKQEASSLLVNVWVNVFQFIGILLLFWTDFIPGFGMSSDPKEFLSNLSRGFRCQYGIDSTCSEVVGRSWLNMLSYGLASFFGFLLLRYAEGAIYLVVVQALVTPLGTLFWTVFAPEPFFHWHPVFDLATGFTLVGLVIMMPAVVIYRYLGHAETKLIINQSESDV